MDTAQLKELKQQAEGLIRQSGFLLSEQERLDFLGGHGGSHAYLVHEFVTAIAENRQPAVNAWEAARYMVMGVMAHKSALKDGELLDVPDFGDAPK